MAYYYFKLNVLPSVLKIFKDLGEFDYLTNEVMLEALGSVSEVVERGSHYELKLREPDYSMLEQKMKILDDLTEDLIKEYADVLNSYRESGTIVYSPEFSNLNNVAGAYRRNLLYTYPVLNNSKKISNKVVDKNFDFDTKVGTGVRHIRSYYKIKKYMQSNHFNQIITSPKVAIYYSLDEKIIIESDSEAAAIRASKDLVHKLNGSKEFVSKVGKVTILPIYEEIRLEGQVTEISYTVVYPNGNRPLDTHDILMKTKAQKVKNTYFSEKGEVLEAGPIMTDINKQGQDGYLEEFEVKSKGEGQLVSQLKSSDFLQ